MSSVAPQQSWVENGEAGVRPSDNARVLAAAILVAIAGLWCLRFQLQALWALWTGDALRSIGALLPPVSIILALRAWTRDNWREGGTWWGMVLIALALGDAMLTSSFSLLISASHLAILNLTPVGLQLCAYASGVVLLFGGTRCWRKAWFPLLLLLFVKPVPGFFSALMDLPLQNFGAHTARAFAAVLGVPVSEGTLKMMFAPDLGMFIGAGCDGLRGATTMGYLALIIGYLYKLPPLRWAAYVTGAVVLAYLFNLLRLCCVVIYYWCALRAPGIGHYGAQVDYAIGGVLFTLAAFFLFALPRHWRYA